MSLDRPRTGARILVDQLRIHGADHVFCVPGESYLAVLDALHDAPDIRVITCRHEGAAAMMAEAYGKLTGRPGICMVTRGPGATNGSAGVHVARQDSTPFIMFIGQVARGMREREAFQEVDYRRVFGQFSKWVAEIDQPDRIPEMLSRAFHTATAGRPGPVVLSLPEDTLVETCVAIDARRYETAVAELSSSQVQRVAQALAKAKRPLMILGGAGWTPSAVESVVAFSELNRLPVATSFRRQDRFPNTHAQYLGDVGIGINPKLAERIKHADLLMVVGSRLGEMASSGYTLINIPTPRQQFIHVHPDPEELGRVYQADQAICASLNAFAAALANIEIADAVSQDWIGWTQEGRNDYLATLLPPVSPGKVQLGEIIRSLSDSLPDDAIIASGAGNFTTWVHRFFQHKRLGTQLAPTSGSMGYGVPAAIAAKIIRPECTVVCVAGDGDFLMTGQELATAVMYGANVIFLVVNNGMYGTIRMHQERYYPDRVVGTDLHNPDFVALAKAYGAYGELVTETAGFQAAFERAVASGAPALIELRVDPEALTINRSLSQIRAGQ